MNGNKWNVDLDTTCSGNTLTEKNIIELINMKEEDFYVTLYEDNMFDVGHWIGTKDFQYITENWADMFQYTREGLENLNYYRKTRSNMTDQQFDKLCDIIAAYANGYENELEVKCIRNYKDEKSNK